MDMIEFAGEWEAGWNSHDLDRIMTHYGEDVVFRSRKALPLVGAAEIRGKANLRMYWQKALERQPDLRFEVRDVLQGHEMMVITYVNHRGVLAAETLYFDDQAKVYMAAACHRLDP